MNPKSWRLGLPAHIAVFLAGCAIVVARRPDALFNAQFYAEDGSVWFQDAHELGIRSLLLPAGGYLNSLSRLIAMAALLAPLSKAPLIMNLAAITLQVLPVSVFLSSRFSNLDLRLRLIGAIGYLVLPNSFEIHANTTNIQFHLALLACLLIFARPVSSVRWRVIEVTTLVMLSLDSPFGLFLIPITAVLWAVRRERWSRIRCLVLLPAGLVQCGFILLSHSRVMTPNGASAMGLVRILARQVFLASLFGLNGVRDLMAEHWHVGYDVAGFVVGMAVLIFALWRAPLELKLFVLFAAGGLAASLARPQATLVGLQWDVLQSPGAANRYYFFPMLAFLAALVWMLSTATPRAVRAAAAVLLAVLPFGVWQDWSHPPLLDLKFQQYVDAFDRAATGDRIAIPINPPPWSMRLTKR